MQAPIPLIGRDEEFRRAYAHLSSAFTGTGRALAISGEPGMGKSRLAREISERWVRDGGMVMGGEADRLSSEPLSPLYRALVGRLPLSAVENAATTRFSEVFAVSTSGLLIAKSGTGEGEGVDADIFAGMFSAVQDFVKDSFERSGGTGGGLGRLEYGELKIIVEHGTDAYLTAVFRGAEHPSMKDAVKASTEAIGRDCADVLARWDGNMDAVRPVQEAVERLAKTPFVFRHGMDGVVLESEVRRISDAVTEALKGASGEKPALLVIEDVHLSDEVTLKVLRQAVSGVGDVKASILITCDAGGDATELLAQGGALRLELAPLDASHVKAFAEAALSGTELPDGATSNLAAGCRGSPFMLLETMRQMAIDGDFSADYAVPISPKDLVNRRMDGLDPDAVALAEYASCAGPTLEMGVIASLKTLKDPKASLQKLVSANILTVTGERLAFSNDLFRGAIYEGIGARWKAAYHRSIGEQLEAVNAEKPDTAGYALAHHFSRSVEYKKAYRYSEMAGELAESWYAPDRAIHHYSDALSALRKGGTEPDAEANLLERLGVLRGLTGDIEGALADLRVAEGMAKSSGLKTRCRERIELLNGAQAHNAAHLNGR